MGTLLRIRVFAPETLTTAETDPVLTAAFDLANELEAKFSKFRATSDTVHVNQSEKEIQVSPEFSQLAQLALELWRTSEGGFNPFSGAAFTPTPPLLIQDLQMRRALPVRLDFSGIAKGFIVDQICEYLVANLSSCSGVINAGGDLRFFATAPDQRAVEVRLPGQRLLSLHIGQDSFATSSYEESLFNPHSTTEYRLSPRPGLTIKHSVCAIAATCAFADALTKVGWFATHEAASACAKKYRAQILVLDHLGNVCQEFGSHETNPPL